MAVSTDDLLSPVGDLIGSLFPSDSPSALEDRLDGYITEGEEKAETVIDPVSHDKAVKHWAYYRAYNAVVVRMSGSPLNTNLAGLLSSGYSSEQIKTIAQLRDSHLADFQALVPEDPDVPAPPVSSPPSGSTPMVFTW